MGRRPRYAGADELVRAVEQRDREWEQGDKDRRVRFLDGDRESPWPEHTWKMRRVNGVEVEGPQPLWPLMIGPRPPL